MAQLAEKVQDTALDALAKLMGKTVEDVTGILESDKPDKIVSDATKRLTELRSEGNKAGRGKLQETAEAKAAELFGLDITEVAGTDDDGKPKKLTIESLLDAIHSKVETDTSGKEGESLTEEQIKGSKLYKDLEKARRDDAKKAKTDLDTAVATERAKGDFETLKTDMFRYRTEAKATVDKVPQIAAAQEQIALDGIKGVTTKAAEDGTVEYWKDGKRLEDTTSLLPLTRDQFFKNVLSKAYVIPVSQQTESSGLNENEGQSEGGQKGTFEHFKGALPKNKAEYDKQMFDRTTNNAKAREELLKWSGTDEGKKALESAT